ncbi:BolA family protein [Neptunomonas japonica]|jgi:BolA protein|uniref:BolA family transcriptional regulator n=1 Tax=Neptunomonas japonica JAMM 1380 TaxID=1441457 RepID=A0A7R6PTL7_9GAMM|nr:BolA/IbaG family iron-sulfur metabolism protein [Neptunomonas japonica]BBB30215.1 BolA family transcriptional regulator [Neptunomonas japonica JAMM 1380]
MSIAIVVEEKLRTDISVSELQIVNESHMHSGPAADSHFKLVLVSDDFAGKRLVQRHQMIYKILAQELQTPIHALSMHLYTQEEWSKKNGEVMASPACKGGSKS